MRYGILSGILLLELALAAGAWAATTSYAATSLGPYKSTDGGVSWQPLKVTVANALLQGVPNATSIAVDPANPNNVYFVGAVTTTSAFFKSADGGQSWAAVLVPGVSFGGTTWLAIDPVATNNLYIESDNKVLRSVDAGATWTDTPGLAAITGIQGVLGIATDPVTSGVLYSSSTSAGVSKSVDFGNTWTTVKLTVAGTTPTVGGIFVNPVNNRQLFVARRFGQGCFNSSGAVDCALFSSADAGTTWQIVSIPGSARGVDFDRITGAIYVGANVTGVGSTVLKSTDNGATWTPLVKNAGGVNDGPLVSADPNVAGVVYDLGDSAGTGGALQKTTDGGTTWSKVTVPGYCSGPTTSDCTLTLQRSPQVNGLAHVVTAAPPALASFGPSGAPGGPMAPEAIVTVKGSHLATGTALADADEPGTTLGGTTVNVTDASGVTRAALVLSVSGGQVVYQVPAGTATGPAVLTIKSGDGTVTTGQIQIAPVSPGLFTLNASGLAKAVAIRVSGGNQFVEDVYEIDGSGAVIPHPITISNGDQVNLIVYGTGFRGAGSDISVTIGSENAQVLYAGPQGDAPGVDQFNILIPADLATGGPQQVSIVLTAAGQTANTVNMTIQ